MKQMLDAQNVDLENDLNEKGVINNIKKVKSLSKDNIFGMKEKIQKVEKSKIALKNNNQTKKSVNKNKSLNIDYAMSGLS